MHFLRPRKCYLVQNATSGSGILEWEFWMLSGVSFKPKLLKPENQGLATGSLLNGSI